MPAAAGIMRESREQLSAIVDGSRRRAGSDGRLRTGTGETPLIHAEKIHGITCKGRGVKLVRRSDVSKFRAKDLREIGKFSAATT